MPVAREKSAGFARTCSCCGPRVHCYVGHSGVCRYTGLRIYLVASCFAAHIISVLLFTQSTMLSPPLNMLHIQQTSSMHRFETSDLKRLKVSHSTLYYIRAAIGLYNSRKRPQNRHRESELCVRHIGKLYFKNAIIMKCGLWVDQTKNGRYAILNTWTDRLSLRSCILITILTSDSKFTKSCNVEIHWTSLKGQWSNS